MAQSNLRKKKKNQENRTSMEIWTNLGLSLHLSNTASTNFFSYLWYSSSFMGSNQIVRLHNKPWLFMTLSLVPQLSFHETPHKTHCLGDALTQLSRCHLYPFLPACNTSTSRTDLLPSISHNVSDAIVKTLCHMPSCSVSPVLSFAWLVSLFKFTFLVVQAPLTPPLTYYHYNIQSRIYLVTWYFIGF